MVERRRFARIDFSASTTLYSGTAAFDVELIDLSLKGLLVTKPADWTGEQGDHLRARIVLDTGAAVGMAVVVARVGADRLGCQVEKIDLDSFGHLKRVVELNLGDSKQLNRELSALG